jgi:hypothetical protein
MVRAPIRDAATGARASSGLAGAQPAPTRRGAFLRSAYE